MATSPGVNQGKGKFLRVFLASNRDAKVEDATAAWKAEGHDDGISESLVSKIRSELGLTAKRGTNGVAKEDAGSKAKGKAEPQKAKGEAKKAKGEAKKAEEAPPRPHGREGDAGPSKSEFVEELLGRQPEANVAAINRAWSEAGNEGQISPSVFFKVKRERGGAVETSPGESASTAPSQPQASEVGFSVVVIEEAPQFIGTTESSSVTASGGVGRVVDEVEAGIDELIFTLKVSGGMPEVEAALRAARRLLVRSNEA